MGSRIEPDLIIVNGDIGTMDPVLPHASALAIGKGLVTAVGSDAEIRSMAAPGARVIDAGGRLVLSGLMTTEEQDVLAAFSPWQIEHRAEEDEWVCVTLRSGSIA